MMQMAWVWVANGGKAVEDNVNHLQHPNQSKTKDGETMSVLSYPLALPIHGIHPLLGDRAKERAT